MLIISGRIGTNAFESHFMKNSVSFHQSGSIHKTIDNIWFLYFQRVDKRLKTCDVIIFNNIEFVEYTIPQNDIEKIADIMTCPIYIGGVDPLPWGKMRTSAQTNNWKLEDWQYVLEDDDDDDSEDDDEEWKPPDDSEDDSEDDDDDDSEDDSEEVRPNAKRRKT